jgi:preprotein translocase subunit YajC
MTGLTLILIINVVALYIICYKQQKRHEIHKYRIDQLQLKVQNLQYNKRDK